MTIDTLAGALVAHCPGCGQPISVDTDGTTECGGIGEGTCAAFNAAVDCLDFRTDRSDEWCFNYVPSDVIVAMMLRAHREAK